MRTHSILLPFDTAGFSVKSLLARILRGASLLVVCIPEHSSGAFPCLALLASRCYIVPCFALRCLAVFVFVYSFYSSESGMQLTMILLPS